MITQVNGLGSGVIKDPRRKAQSVQFKHRSTIPYKSGYNEQYAQQRKSALWTSLSIIAGTVMLAVGYFLMTAFHHPSKVPTPHRA